MSDVRGLPVQQPERFVTRQELADLMGLNVRSIDHMVIDGMPSYVWGKRTRRFRASEAIAWAADRRRVPGAPRPHSPYESWEPTERDYARILLGDPCGYCGAPTEHIDHIEPKIRGGAHSWQNFTAACQHCNSGKSGRPLLMFMLGRMRA